MAFAEGPIIDAEHPWRGHRDHGGATDQAQQGGWTGGHSQTLNNPGPRLATECERQQTHHPREALGPPSLRSADGGQPFGEDPTCAGRLAAKELADAEMEPNRLTAPWQISD